MTHDSDCSLHNGPALPVGPCDCSVKYPQLSRRAIKLLKRVRAGYWYPWHGPYDPRTPKAMQELLNAGLVGTCGRVVTVQACFVPRGFKPHKPERYPS